MKKTIFLLALIIVMIFFISGCSKDMKEPPAISVSVDNKEIEYVSAKNKWKGSVYDREDTFVTILNEQKDIPIFKHGSIAEITFKSNPPDELKIMDILIDDNGRQIYTDKEIINIDVKLNNGKCSFEIEKHLASFLSSHYEPEKKDIRGFRMIASWGENECEYAFIIKTYSTYEGESESENNGDKIDRSKYLTGEIITDGKYAFPSNGFGIIYFVPDEESSQIIKEKYNIAEESLQLKYEDLSQVAHLPKELGIYKVKVDLKKEEYNWLAINDIQLIDTIGTVSYHGKTYETNELDENVKVKDNVCGLIVKWIYRDEVDGGIQIRFAGEIASEGYYFIYYDDLMYGENRCSIFFDEEYFDNIPFYGERGFNNFSFFRTNELFDELQNFSSFGRGKFKTSNYLLIYNIGMGRPVSDNLTEIISLDEAYKDMFIFDKNTYVGLSDKAKDFIIVSSANYDENQNHISTDYYYINKKNPNRLFLFSSGSYNYDLKVVSNENEFIMSTDGYNYSTGENEGGHVIIFKIIEDGVESKRLEGLSIDSNKIDNNAISYNMQGYISDIKINENNVIITLTDIRMKKEDELAFGDSPNELKILIADYNNHGPYIRSGDRIMINCKYTVDKTLYSFGDDISLR